MVSDLLLELCFTFLFETRTYHNKIQVKFDVDHNGIIHALFKIYDH